MTLNSLKNDICSQYRRSNLSKTLHLYLYVLSDGTNMSRLTQLEIVLWRIVKYPCNTALS